MAERIDNHASQDALCLHVFWPKGTLVAPIPGDDGLVIGRSEACNLRIGDSSLSRRHARVYRVPKSSAAGDEALFAEDLGSRNGTRVDGQEIPEGRSVPIGLGSILEVGSIIAVVREPPATGPSGPAPSAMERLEQLVGLVAKSRIGLLVLGEAGVGKTILARRIHDASDRANGPFVSINFAALPASLAEEELFGNPRGATLGASEPRSGLLESADKGTLFLDEIGDIPLEVQAKLLQTLESGFVPRLGATRTAPLDLRTIAASNRDLKAGISRGTFRRDLFDRLDGLSITVPPLRERPEHVPLLASTLLAEVAAELGRQVTFAPDVLEVLARQPWPGNVRELRSVIKRTVLQCPGAVLQAADLRLDEAPLRARTESRAPLGAPAEHERQRIVDALAACAGNPSRASALLGISRRTLVERIARYGIAQPSGPRPPRGRP